MEKEFREECLAEGMLLEAIGKQVGKHESTVSHWLKKYGLEAARTKKHSAKGAPSKEETERFLVAGLSLREVAHRLDRSLATIRHWMKEEAGGKCVLCGYSRCLRALEFHHLDPSAKQFELGYRGCTRSLDALRAEASKCVLLCSNCHAGVEAGITAVPLNSVPDAVPG